MDSNNQSIFVDTTDKQLIFSILETSMSTFNPLVGLVGGSIIGTHDRACFVSDERHFHLIF